MRWEVFDLPGLRGLLFSPSASRAPTSVLSSLPTPAPSTFFGNLTNRYYVVIAIVGLVSLVVVLDLPEYQQEAVTKTISADNLRDALDIVARLQAAAGG